MTEIMLKCLMIAGNLWVVGEETAARVDNVAAWQEYVQKEVFVKNRSGVHISLISGGDVLMKDITANDFLTTLTFCSEQQLMSDDE